MTNRRIPRRVRLLVRERAHGCCEYCLSQEAYATQGFSVEHIVPLHSEGKTIASNLALACQGCNNFKYDKTSATDPASHQVASLFHPRRDTWHTHFIWNEDCTLIVGLTSTGRATIATLQLNREGVVNLRRVLVSTGKHPPHFPLQQ